MICSKRCRAKENARQTYNEIQPKMPKRVIAVKERNQYDEFLHKIQQPKMKELWDNKEDERRAEVLPAEK